MPIDYAKFDHIGSDDEEDGKGSKDNFQDIMQQCLRGLAKPSGADCPDPGYDPGYGFDPGEFGAPDPFDDDPMSFDFDGSDAGGFGGGFGSSRPLDLAALHDEAFQLLLTRLVCQPGASSIARALLLDAELDLLACGYQKALVGALALKLATSQSSSSTLTSQGPRQLCRIGGVAEQSEQWLAPALVIEMVAAYQLGDREHAVATRDRLTEMPRDSLSMHLQKRFEGTSEILELVPQFLSLLQKGDGADTDGGTR